MTRISGHDRNIFIIIRLRGTARRGHKTDGRSSLKVGAPKAATAVKVQMSFTAHPHPPLGTVGYVRRERSSNVHADVPVGGPPIRWPAAV